jgi:hypothetical protein
LTKVKRKSSKSSQRQSWMTVSKHRCNLEIDINKPRDLHFAFANHGGEDKIYPLTTIEIAEAQCKDQKLKVYYKKDTKVLCKNGKLIIPTDL